MSNSEAAEPYTIIEPLGGPLAGDVSVPGDKSISHRAVLFSAMAAGTSHLTGVLDSEDVRASIREARSRGIWVSLNLLVFPGVTDTEEELDALARLVGENGVSMIQWRNLNIDPEWYFRLMSGGEGQQKLELSPSMGLTSFMKRLKKLCPWLRYGYFNPYLGEKAELAAPMPGEWSMPAPRAREAAAATEDDIDGAEVGGADQDVAEAEASRVE